MPKRGRAAADAVPSKSCDTNIITCIICGIYNDGRTAVAKCLLTELKSATVIACDLKAGRRAIPKKAGEFEVRAYTDATPQLPTPGLLQNVVVLPHELARPSRVAAAMASDNKCAVWLLAVLDARSFLDDWESPEKLPSALRSNFNTR